MTRNRKGKGGSSSLGDDAGSGSTTFKRAMSMGTNQNTQSPARPGRLEGGTSGFNLIGNVGRTSIPTYPPPNLYKAPSSRVFSTEVIRDRVFAAKPAVWIPYANVNFATGTTPQYFNTAGTSDAVVDAQFGTLAKSTYSMIVRAIMVDGGLAMKDTVLNNGGTLTDSFSYWVNQYASSFCVLRGLQGCLGMGNFNLAASLIANAVNQNIFALEAGLRRLLTFPVPPLLVRYLDRLCGPIARSEDDTLIIAGIGANTDLTNSTNVANLLTAASNGLSNLMSGNGGSTNATNDLQAVTNTLAIAYGSPDIPSDKPIQSDATAYAIQMFQCGSWRNDTTTTTYTWPNINGSVNVPIMVPRGASGECLEQAMTLFRPSVYSGDPVAGVSTAAQLPQQIGLISNVAANGNGSGAVVYNQLGVGAVKSNHAAGTKTYTFTDPESELLPWIELSGPTTQTDYSNDQRNFAGFDRFYMTRDMLIDETAYVWEKMWLDPIRGGQRAIRERQTSK